MSARSGRERDGIDLALLHGWGMNDGVWDGLPSGFAQRHRLHPIALPGHGGRPFGAESADLDGWAVACLAMAPPRAVWVGWSLGGLVSLAAALRAPARVAALVLITATPRFTRGADWPLAMPVGTMDQFHASMLEDPIATLERFLALQVRGSDAAGATLRRLRGSVRRHPPPEGPALTQGLRLLREADLRSRLPDLACPSLWLFGERDTLVPAALADCIPGLAAGARARVIAGAGHAPLVSHPDASAMAMESFLTEVAA